jgi:hypothetical protein
VEQRWAYHQPAVPTFFKSGRRAFPVLPFVVHVGGGRPHGYVGFGLLFLLTLADDDLLTRMKIFQAVKMGRRLKVVKGIEFTSGG